MLNPLTTPTIPHVQTHGHMGNSRCNSRCIRDIPVTVVLNHPITPACLFLHVSTSYAYCVGPPYFSLSLSSSSVFPSHHPKFPSPYLCSSNFYLHFSFQSLYRLHTSVFQASVSIHFSWKVSISGFPYHPLFVYDILHGLQQSPIQSTGGLFIAT